MREQKIWEENEKKVPIVRKTEVKICVLVHWLSRDIWGMPMQTSHAAAAESKQQTTQKQTDITWVKTFRIDV